MKLQRIQQEESNDQLDLENQGKPRQSEDTIETSNKIAISNISDLGIPKPQIKSIRTMERKNNNLNII